jgi:hypothetical protein
VFQDVETADAGGSRGGRQKARKDAHRGGFTGAVGAEKTDDLSFIDLERDIVDSDSAGVSLGKTLDFNHNVVFLIGADVTGVILTQAGASREAPKRFILNEIP